jgi:hypothetical protein
LPVLLSFNGSKFELVYGKQRGNRKKDLFTELSEEEEEEEEEDEEEEEEEEEKRRKQTSEMQ